MPRSPFPSGRAGRRRKLGCDSPLPAPVGKLIPFPVHSPLWELLVSVSVSVEQVLLSLLTGSSAVPSCCSGHGPGREGGRPQFQGGE